MNIYKLYDYDYKQKYQGMIVICESIIKATNQYVNIFGKEPKRIKQLNTTQDKVVNIMAGYKE